MCFFILIFWGTLIFSSVVQGVVHLGGDYASVQIVGADGTMHDVSSIVNEKAASNITVNNKDSEGENDSAMAQLPEDQRPQQKKNFKRLSKLERLVKRLSVVVRKTEKQQQDGAFIAPVLQGASLLSDSKWLLDGDVSIINDKIFDGSFGQNPVRVAFDGGAKLLCFAEKQSLKRDDVLYVKGVQNELIIKENFDFNGSINFVQPNAELAIRIERGAVLRMAPLGNRLHIPSGCRLIFTGDGVVEIFSGLKFIFDPAVSAAGLIFGGGVKVVLSNGNCEVVGCGQVLFDAQARLNVELGQKWIIGGSDKDDIVFSFSGDSVCTVSGDSSALEFLQGTYEFLLLDRAVVNVEAGARLSMRGVDSLAGKKSICRRFFIENYGRFNLGFGACWELGPQDAVCDLKITENAFAGTQGSIFYPGLPELMSLELRSQVQGVMSLQNFVRNLLNSKPEFCWASLLKGLSTTEWVLLPDSVLGLDHFALGKIIKVNKGEVIVAEDALNRRVLGLNNGCFFELCSEGNVAYVPKTRSGLPPLILQKNISDFRSFFSIKRQ